jgi:glucosamine--fructose-6-phosphate aminotransferase (isomerizing)
MLKEIWEQPTTLRQAMEHRLNEFLGTAHFEELTLPLHELQSITKIVIIGCGTSYHAGCAASLLLEEIARIQATAVIALTNSKLTSNKNSKVNPHNLISG